MAGMPLFASFLGSIFGGLVAFFSKYLTKKLAIFSAVLVAIASLTFSFFLLVETIVSSVTVGFPSDLANIGFLIPSNYSSVMAAAISISVSRWVYDWNIKIWQYKLTF